jgi:hypothetical protein
VPPLPQFNFTLRKLNAEYTFQVQKEEELHLWLEALRPYVVQDDIQQNYRFLNALGQGSYGEVFLATQKQPASQK